MLKMSYVGCSGQTQAISAQFNQSAAR